jgi:hypothetical protein
VVNLRAVPWGFLRAVESDFFVEYVEKPTDNTRWRGPLFSMEALLLGGFRKRAGAAPVEA